MRIVLIKNLERFAKYRTAPQRGNPVKMPDFWQTIGLDQDFGLT